MEQRTPEWHAARVGRVTASVAGAILGVAPYATRADILRRMVREYHKAAPEFTGNIATDYGTNHEAGALAEYQMESGNGVTLVGFVPFEDWLGASPDGVIDEYSLVEIKCPFGKRKDEHPEFKGIADQPHYYAQVQVQLLCTGIGSADFYQWAPGGTKLERVEYDREWIASNLPRLKQFHAEYLDALDDPAEHLAPRRAEVDTLEAHRMVREWDELATAIELATARKKDLLDEMQAMAGGRDSIFAGRKLTKVERAGAVSYAQAIKKYAPDADLDPFRGKPSEFWKLG